ncbi:NUDIX hydrolase OS=Lysinibacillus sphaericus OX=1421 GN=LS41612_02185 PE=4 SV=1 [Lysinibacillus sphaericus]
MRHFTAGLSTRTYIYFQIRSGQKKDYPGLLDITAAGHLLAVETVEAGIREVKEELGVNN